MGRACFILSRNSKQDTRGTVSSAVPCDDLNRADSTHSSSPFQSFLYEIPEKNSLNPFHYIWLLHHRTGMTEGELLICHSSYHRQCTLGTIWLCPCTREMCGVLTRQLTGPVVEISCFPFDTTRSSQWYREFVACIAALIQGLNWVFLRFAPGMPFTNFGEEAICCVCYLASGVSDWTSGKVC